jgi:hypothetical protein
LDLPGGQKIKRDSSNRGTTHDQRLSQGKRDQEEGQGQETQGEAGADHTQAQDQARGLVDRNNEMPGSHQKTATAKNAWRFCFGTGKPINLDAIAD